MSDKTKIPRVDQLLDTSTKLTPMSWEPHPVLHQPSWSSLGPKVAKLAYLSM